MRASTTSLVCLLALLTWSEKAEAGKLRWTRGAGCREGNDVRVVVQHRQGPTDTLLPIPKRRSAPKLRATELIVIDVALAEAMPTRRTDAPPRPPPPSKVVTRIDSRSDFRCIGLPRGQAGMLRVVSAAPGTRFWGHPYPESWRRDNIVPAGVFNLRQAVPALLRHVQRPFPADLDGGHQFELWAVKRDAAIALADLGATSAAKAVRTHVEQLEKQNINVWDDTVPALRRLDPKMAEAYAFTVLTRELKTPSEHAATFVDELLPWLVRRTPQNLALVRALSQKMEKSRVGCDLFGARIRLGDDALLAEVRPHLTGTILSGRVTVCYTAIVNAAAPGEDPGELDILLHRHRWSAIVSLLVNMQNSERKGTRDPRFAKARQEIEAWLTKQENTPRIQRNERDRRYTPSLRARFLATYAHLRPQDPKAQKDLADFVADGSDDTTAPYIAARDALRLDVAGAADAAAQLLRLGEKRSPRRYSSRSWTERGHLHVTETGEVVEELHRRGDLRFALGLLQRDGFAAELTASLIARHAPSSQLCKVVVDAADAADKSAIDFAFWTLSAHRDTCRAQLKAAARDPKRPPKVRGMATEALAMMRDPAVPSLVKMRKGKGTGDLFFDASLARAKLIHDSPE